ncbi:ATP-dependent DNA ligase [Archaeoglobus veneficus]|uniref:DNA ligase n=1 Tax=Archaeoglobus veneficus (strain DSM 11195 / SNP6) TaxID=693661 RepID=F2KQN9_ARCVS|nr:ATP-dependent DNA ligase [Archaeoglobus veneficus]AEA46601.1 DNA ligase [Archaeoglobus veneficus SNP6]
MLFKEFAEFCSVIEKISSTLELAARIAAFIKGIEDDNDLYNVVLFLMGKVYPPWDERELGVGVGLIYEALRVATGTNRSKIEELIKETGDLGIAAEKLLQTKTQLTLFEEELTVAKVREVFDTMSSLTGEGSQKRKIRLLADLYFSATPIEARYLTRLILSEMRLGVGEGIVRDAIARAWGIEEALVERAYMITNDFGKVAVVAKNEGKEGLEKMKIELHVPVRMMLAQVAESIDQAIREMSRVAVEWKFDGTRVQVHWGNGKVTIYSRRLENVTRALPEIVEEIKSNVKEGVILDGEVVAMKEGRPMPFQHILRRFRRKYEVSKMMEKIPIHAQFFDILYCDGKEVIDLPLEERRKLLESVVRSSDRIWVAKQVVTSDAAVIEQVYNEALNAGHEGAMLKNPKSPYIPGKRGKHWLKLKPVMETLDLVVIGGEWGEGKRSHVISSYEIACLDPTTGKLLPVGKVATGFTDEELEEFTELFRPLIEYEEGKKIVLQPKYVFEVAYQEIQKSPKYESGYALRFPRFVRLREDKDVGEADTIDRVARLYESQFKGKKT